MLEGVWLSSFGGTLTFANSSGMYRNELIKRYQSFKYKWTGRDFIMTINKDELTFFRIGNLLIFPKGISTYNGETFIHQKDDPIFQGD